MDLVRPHCETFPNDFAALQQDHVHIDFCCIVRVVVRSFSSRGSYNFVFKSGCIDLVCAAYQPGISSDEETE
jgi:hypothetical protein